MAAAVPSAIQNAIRKFAMLMTFTLTATPQAKATDLGYLLHKHPAKVQRFTQSFGQAVVFYPQADEARCTAALLVDIDPVQLVRGKAGAGEGLLAQYVNDRPYAASSLLAVALGNVFRSALNGRCPERPELAAAELPFIVEIPVLACRGGEAVLRKLFEPLGYAVQAECMLYDQAFPAWGDSPYFGVRLDVTAPLSRVLAQISVLLPVLDGEKHYWIGDAEVDKLLQRGGGWLAAHPHKDLIARRYLKHRESLTRQALRRLEAQDFSSQEEDAPQDVGQDAAVDVGMGDDAATAPQAAKEAAEAALEKSLSLNRRRIDAVLGKVEALGAVSVVDVGCGEGKLLAELARKKTLARIVGMDVSSRALEIAEQRLDRMPPLQKKRITLLQGSLTYRDKRLSGFDAATCVEVIEHLDPERVGELARTLLEFARPKAVILTTPNREYNVLFAGMRPGALRHADHRFEWTRDEFRDWAEAAAARYGYRVTIEGIGDADETLGTPTQMAVFERRDEETAEAAS